MRLMIRDYSAGAWLLRFAFFDLRGPGLARTRGNATWPCAERRRVAHRDRVFVCNTDFFGDPAPVDRCPVQESKSALDWTGSDGRSRLGYCD